MFNKKRKSPNAQYGKKKPRRRLPFNFSELDPELLKGPLGQPCTPVERRGGMSFVPPNHQPEALRPKSQKAATMMVEPTDDQIATVAAWTACDKETAKRYLRVKQCDLEQAVNAVLNNENITELENGNTWDSNVWDTDRDGNANLHPLGANSTAPTRGNSPAPSLKDTAPTSNEQSDADLARAIAMSTEQETGEPFGGWKQETGTISNGGAEFRKIGPDTEQQHKEGQWGMVLHKASELIPDVPIEERVQRGEDQSPRFLKHTPDGDYTPNLLTICNSIPAAREAFLLAGSPMEDYGYEAEWWKGVPISKPRIVHADGGSAVDENTDAIDEFVAELHRLTAFFDTSARVYASIGGLIETKAIKERTFVPVLGTVLETFLSTFTTIAGTKGGDQADQIAGLFMTRAGKIGDTSGDKDSSTILDLESRCPDDVPEDSKPDLTECLDRMVWSTDSDDDQPQQYCLDKPANILVMRLKQTDKSASHLNVTVPSTLTMDKYTEENVPATKALREQLVLSKRRIKKISEIEKKLKYWTRDGKQLDSQQLLKHSHGHFSGQNRKDVDLADKTNSVSLSTDQPPHYRDIAQQLETVMASIDEKLKVLAEEKAKTQKAIGELSKATIPALEGRESQHRYTLRGVATKPNITYVLQPKTHDDDQAQAAEHNEMKDVVTSVQEEDNTTPAGFQWWRIDYEVSGQTAKITRTKADDFDVIRAAELEHNSALLVYASDDAVEDVDPSELPLPLKEFVLRDNAAVQADIDASRRNPPPPYQDQTADWGGIRPSVEHRERDNDNDSNSSMQAQHDGQPYTRKDHVGIIDGPPQIDMHDWLNTNDHANYTSGDIIGGIDPFDPPPVDIRLDEPEASSSTQYNYMDATSNREMEEKKGMPSLIPAPGTPSTQMPVIDTNEDVGMSGMGDSQDMGIGGGASGYVEEVRKGG